MVICYAAVNEVECSSVAAIDAAAALPVISSVGCHVVLGDIHMIQCQRAVVEDATRQLEAVALRDGQLLDGRGCARIDDEDTIGVVPADRQAGRSRAIDRHIFPERQRTGEQCDRLTGQRVGEVHRATDADTAQRPAQRSRASVRGVGHSHIAWCV